MVKGRSASETANVRFPPPVLYAGSLALAVLVDDVLTLGALFELRWRLLAGVPFVAVGLALDVWALVTMRRARTTIIPWGRASALVTEGPFRLSRNPIYVGYALEYAGFALMLGSWSAWALFLPVYFLMDRYVIPREEAHLAHVFGADYEAYRTRVRRWI